MTSIRRLHSLWVVLCLASVPPMVVPRTLLAQSIMERLKQKAKEKAEAEANKKSEADASRKSADSAKAAQPPAATPAAPVTPAAPAATDAAPATKFTDGIALNFDFIAGDRVLFFEDFSADKVGDLPLRMDIQSGNFSVADHRGRHALVNNTGGELSFKLPELLPDRYTMEVEFHLVANGNPMKFYMNGDNSLTVGCWRRTTYIEGQGADGLKSAGEQIPGDADVDVGVCRFMIDRGYAKAYFGGTRTAQLNGLPTTRTDKIRVEFPGSDAADPILLYSVRVAAGGKKLWDAITSSGRVSINGILFDTGSDHIRAESTPVLKDIGNMLREHPELKLLVEGHTDNVGSATLNLALSDKRAAAVKAWLIDKEQVVGSRLTTKGMGDTKPAASNTSPEGRQNNRRVDLVKQP